ncbi:MAG: hypothetical protein ACR2O0_01770, partial [Rhizobiaceae bacterium]
VLATLCIAGDIAISAGILPEVVDVFEPCLWGWEMYIDSSEGEARDVVNRSIADLRGYIAKSVDSRIIQIGSDAISYQGTEGWYDEEFIYLPKSVVEKLFSTKPAAVCKQPHSDGLLEKQGKNYWHNTIPGVMKHLPHIRLKKKEFFAEKVGRKKARSS